MIDTRAGSIDIPAVPRCSPRPWRLAAWAALALAVAPGCGKARCTTEITEGEATWKGVAEGKKGQLKLDRDAMVGACRQMCAAKKSPIVDACAARCTADIDAAKLSAKTTCTDR